jgi:hypothetical protein
MASKNAVQARIDAAVEAERERCALIVERFSLPTIQTPSMWLVDKAAIASYIRNPDTANIYD